jgi:hypothetical protein
MSNHTKTSFPPRGIEEWGLGGPLFLLMRFTMILLGATCDHSLGGSQVLTMFSKSLLKIGMLLGSQMLLFHQNPAESPLVCSLNPQKQQVIVEENAPNYFGTVCKKDVRRRGKIYSRKPMIN